MQCFGSSHFCPGFMNLLTIETTCDETAAAIISGDLSVLSHVVASQEALHERYQGVVPEIAARAHEQRILPVIHDALHQAGVKINDLNAIAVATTPGLAGSLLIGLMAAKTLAMVLDVPLISVNHLHAHVYACQLAVQQKAVVYPCVGMIVSGGHSHLYRFDDPITAELLGGTIDDAAGEAFDKVASMLGLPYPGGPHVSRVAESGNEKAHSFPRSFLKEDRLDFSFSGLKTAVRYAITGPGSHKVDSSKLTDGQISDLAASFQAAVVDCLVAKAIQACKQSGLKMLCVGGGVAANGRFRNQLAAAAVATGIELHIAPMEYCTDNAAMGAIAIERFNRGLFEDLELDIQPGLVRV